MANYLVDLDGTICDDIPNEEFERYENAILIEGAKELLEELHKDGYTITYFTAREEKDRKVTLEWLKKKGLPMDGLIMDKPRGGKIIILDNHPIKTFHFKGVWSQAKRWLVKKMAELIKK
jgi:uncharacterized HAD superfamily protein